MTEQGKVLTGKKDFMRLLGVTEYLFDKYVEKGFIKHKKVNGRYTGYSTVVLKHFAECMEQDS